MEWKAYAFCVLEQLHRTLRRREVFAKDYSKWGDPRAKLLGGDAWKRAKPIVPASLNLPGEAGEYLAARAALLELFSWTGTDQRSPRSPAARGG